MRLSPALVLALVLSAACGQASTREAAGPVSLSLWSHGGTPGEQAALRSTITAFERDHPSVTVAIRVVMFGLLPSWGLSNAAATMVGQSLGAKKPDRAEESVWRAGRFNFYFLGGLGLLFVVMAPWIVRIFVPAGESEVSGHAIAALRIISLGFPFYAYGMVLSNAFNGAGDTRTPTLINIGCFWLLEIPLAYLLALPLGWGPTGVFVAIAVSFSLLALISAVIFRQGKWKHKAV